MALYGLKLHGLDFVKRVNTEIAPFATIAGLLVARPTKAYGECAETSFMLDTFV
jgi:hypothetical protein